MIRRIFTSLCITLALAAVPIMLSGQAAVAPALEPKVDAVFAKWNASTPGCAVGVSTGGKPALMKGYGMADLEHDVKIAPDTIFEAGSVSKQFTAAAILLLAREGKLSLDDPVRKYIPELPDYAQRETDRSGSAGLALSEPLALRPAQGQRRVEGSNGEAQTRAGAGALTIRHMLNHTSGLRDWGSVAAIGGWPRTTRVHTHAHVLDIVSRQRATNFTPGTQWSYSNTGFNLAAIIVSRVSNMPFAEFTRTRLFQPLGLTHTSWRDDYTRIVKGRAMAYSSKSDGFHTLMPFENVHGNGGLLTTVGDLLKWNGNFVSPVVGDQSFVAEQQKPGHFTDGRVHGYALGLFVGTYKGLREVYHSGSTAGYQAFLTRFPDERVSVAVLCNTSNAQATQYAHAVADVYLADRLKPAATDSSLTPAQLQQAAGIYRSTMTGLTVAVGGERDALRGRKWSFDGRGATATDQYGTVESFERVEPAKPTAEQLGPLAGTYTSEEAETTITTAVEHGALVLKQRPDTTITLTPLYADAFRAGALGTVIFRRDAGGRATSFSVVQDRVWDLRFQRSR
jgi:CubicO group peptidase (beta-lactamase class C family)